MGWASANGIFEAVTRWCVRDFGHDSDHGDDLGRTWPRKADAARAHLPNGLTGERAGRADHVEQAGDALRGVYRERARLIAYLAAVYPARICDNDPDAPDWSVIYVETPAGQLSWHIADDDLDLFDHVPRVAPGDAGAPVWDGHSTQSKYDRLARLIEMETDLASCRICGCTEDNACEGGCHWVPNPLAVDICSACAQRLAHALGLPPGGAERAAAYINGDDGYPALHCNGCSAHTCQKPAGGTA